MPLFLASCGRYTEQGALMWLQVSPLPPSQAALHHISISLVTIDIAENPPGRTPWSEGYTPSRQVPGSMEKQKGSCFLDRQRGTMHAESPSLSLKLLLGALPGLAPPLGLCAPGIKNTMACAEFSSGSCSYQGMPTMEDGHRLCLLS